MTMLSANCEYVIRPRSDQLNQKRFVFVKLTDSAVKSIESYIRKKNELNTTPTIQFKGNEGQMCIPSLLGNTSTNFKFSFLEMPKTKSARGSFSCIQQTSDCRSREYEKLGAMTMKMTVKANEDVYETTKNRISVAQEARQKNCTKIIKNNMDIVKAKSKVVTLHKANAPVVLKPLNVVRKKKFSEDITKISLKERLIHLLALRPYKKPQIIDRISKEGGTKSTIPITAVLNEVATLKENTYNLRRHLWNDVQDDWPFYSESEKQLLKRRKPQNLTPPESDGSGNSLGSANSANSAPNSLGSGNSHDSGNSVISTISNITNSTQFSNTSTVNSASSGIGSSIQSTSPKRTHSDNDNKTAKRYNNSQRPGYFVANDGLMTKKPRISHYKKSNEFYNSPEHLSLEALSPELFTNIELLPAAMAHDSAKTGPPTSLPANSSSNTNLNDFKIPRNAPAATASLKKPEISVPAPPTHSSHTPTTMPTLTVPNVADSSIVNQRKPKETEGKKVISLETFRNRYGNGNNKQNVPTQQNTQPQSTSIPFNSVENFVNTNHTVSRKRPADCMEPDSDKLRTSMTDYVPKSAVSDDNCDYLKEYTTIRNDEQMHQYRKDFEFLFEEYNILRTTIYKVSSHFQKLQDEVNRYNANSKEYAEAVYRIGVEYDKYNAGDDHKITRKRHNYIYNKLAHIRKLCVEYQQKYC